MGRIRFLYKEKEASVMQQGWLVSPLQDNLVDLCTKLHTDVAWSVTISNYDQDWCPLRQYPCFLQHHVTGSIPQLAKATTRENQVTLLGMTQEKLMHTPELPLISHPK